MRGVSLWETATHGASYNPLSAWVIQNPYQTYARLRRHSPVHRSTILGSWVLTRYEDVLAAAKDHERFSNDPRWRRATTSVLPPAPDDYSILLVDPPEHTRLRKVVAEVFSRSNLIALNETIAETASELVERAARRRTIDWIGDVAAPASMRVMLSMMAIPQSDHEQWEIWTRDRARLLEMIATRSSARPRIWRAPRFNDTSRGSCVIGCTLPSPMRSACWRGTPPKETESAPWKPATC